MRRTAQAILAATAVLLALVVTAPAQASGGGHRIEVSGQATISQPTIEGGCVQGGDGLAQTWRYVGEVQPLGILDPDLSTGEGCNVLKQPGTTPFGDTGWRVILLRGGATVLTAADGSGSLTFTVNGKLTFSDKPEDLDLATTTLSMHETWVVTGGTGAYDGATGRVEVSATDVAVADFLAEAVTVQFSGGIVVR